MLANCIHNWLKDPTRLKKLRYKVNVMGFPGEKYRISGSVTNIDSEAGLAVCDLLVLNSQDLLAVSANATISI
jgi:hypothetical protein